MQIVIVRRLDRPILIGSGQAASTSRAIQEAEAQARNRTNPKMILRAGDLSLTVPYAPRESAQSGFGVTYAEVPRPGRSPLLMRQGDQLRKQSFDLFFGTVDITRNVIPDMSVLFALAQAVEPIRIANGPGAGTLWRITNLTMNTQEAGPKNVVTRATATVELTEVSDLKNKPGPIAGGKQPVSTTTAPKPTGATTTISGATAPKPVAQVRTHTVKSGETLSSISNTFYGTPTRWKALADANGICNPDLIQVGQRLKIPA